MSAASVLARAQAAAAALMVDACTVRHRAGSATDPETGVDTPTYTTVYTGPCKIQQRAAGASPTSVGQAEVLIGQLEVHLPLSATGVSSDDLVTVTASAHDPDLVGRTFRVRGLSHKSFLSARRFAVIEVTS